ncbi:MAG: hypothetical protein NVS4B7_11640 [Ktedonobacteraceae bacterium]
MLAGVKAKEMGVLGSRQARLPVRLIMLRVLQQVVKQRRQHVREVAQAHRRDPSKAP